MKTKNNIQKTGFGQVKKLVNCGFAILFCSVFINLTVSASDFNRQFLQNSNCNKMVDCPSDVSMMDAILIESGVKSLVYNAQDFVEAEVVAETEIYMNSNCDDVEAELSFQIEGYNANEFVDAEMAAETEQFVNSYRDSSEAELSLESDLTFQVEVYNAQNFADAEMSGEIESWKMMQDFQKSTDMLSVANTVGKIEKFAQK